MSATTLIVQNAKPSGFINMANEEFTVELPATQTTPVLSHRHLGTDAPKISVKNVDGIIETVETLPDSSPNSFYGQIKVYSSGTNGTLCVYDALNRNWKVFGTLNYKNANKELDNLQDVSINESLNPATDSTINLGTPFRKWAHGYVDTLVVAQSATIKEISSTPVAVADSSRLFTNSTNNLYFQDGDGTNNNLAKKTDILCVIGGTGINTTAGQTVYTWPFWNSNISSAYASYRIAFNCIAYRLNVRFGENATTGNSEVAIQRNNDTELIGVTIPAGSTKDVTDTTNSQVFYTGDTMRIRISNGGGGAAQTGYWSMLLKPI